MGGPAIHASLLSARLDPARFETLLVAGHEDPAEGSMLELGRLPEGLRVLRVAALGRAVSPLDDLRALAALVAIARRFKPHVVHTHLAKAGFVGRLAARVAGARVVVHTYHGSVFQGYFGRRESRLYVAIERWLARLSTRLVAITPSGRRELVTLGIARDEKIALIPLGLDLAPLRAGPERADAREALGLPASAPVVGIVARLVPIKDVGTFLRAVAQVANTHPDLVALIAGDGAERTALEALAASLGIADRCRFLGFRADVARLYAALDVLALTSLNEGSPVSVIEAMAAGCAVVATAVGGVPDVVRAEETGLLVPARDPEAVAGAMVRLLDAPELRARLGREAAEAVYPRYDVARLVTDVEDLYLRLLR